MSRSHSNRAWNSSYDHSAHDQSTYFQRAARREINHHRPTVPLSRIAAAASASASFTQRPPWLDSDWNEPTRPTPHSHQQQQPKRRRPAAINPASSQSHSFHRHYDRKRSRHAEQEYYQPYSNHRSTPNPTAHNRPTQAQRHHHHHHHQSPPVPPSYRPSMPPSSSSSSASPSSYTQYHRHGLIFESPVYHPPVYHQPSMSAHLYQRPSFAFLLTDLLHRTVHTHATAYSESHIHPHPPAASIDLIAYAWMSPSHDIFSLSPAFNIQFGDFFDLIVPEETPVVGLTDGELERLPTVTYSNTCAGVDHGDKCAVCLSEYTDGEQLKRLRCKHYFHSECIDPWLKTSTRCPICRGQQTS